MGKCEVVEDKPCRTRVDEGCLRKKWVTKNEIGSLRLRGGTWGDKRGLLHKHISSAHLHRQRASLMRVAALLHRAGRARGIDAAPLLSHLSMRPRSVLASSQMLAVAFSRKAGQQRETDAAKALRQMTGKVLSAQAN